MLGELRRHVWTVRRMIMWMLMIMLSVVIMFFAAIMKMMMIMRMKMIMIVTRGDAGYRVDAIDLHLDTLRLRRHRDNQGANISADVEHDRALACVWILHGHVATSFPSMRHGLRNVNCPEHPLGARSSSRGALHLGSPGRVW